MALKLTLSLSDLISDEPLPKRKALSNFISKDAIKREFGNRVIDKIKERTLSGKDKDNAPFVPYSEMYKQSLNFKIYGKSSRVNLKLTGEMQASISVTGTGARSVTIGFLSEEQSTKAQGHVDGSGRLPVRDFWGLKREEQKKILKSVIKDFGDSDLDSLQGAFDVLGQIGVAGGTDA